MSLERLISRPRLRHGNLGGVAALSLANLGSALAAFVSVFEAAWLLSPGAYAEWVALSALMLLGAPLGSTFQINSVQRSVGGEVRLGTLIRQDVVPILVISGLVLPAALVVAKPLALPVLASMLALLALPIGVLQGITFGWLQGRLEFWSIAKISIALAIARPLVVLWAFSQDSNQVVLGMAAQTAASAIILLLAAAFLIVRKGAIQEVIEGPRRQGFLLQFVAISSLIALTSTDVLVSRIILPTNELSQYATGSLVVRIASFVPIAVASVALPRMFSSNFVSRRRMLIFLGIATLSSIFVFCGVAIVGVWKPAEVLILSPSYALAFSALGLLFAAISYVVYQTLAVKPVLAASALLAALGTVTACLWILGPQSILGLASSYASGAICGICVMIVGLLRRDAKSHER